MRTLVDLRFGPGTWQSIVDERSKRIQEAKEQAAIERKKELKRQKEIEETIKAGAIIGGVILMVVSFFIFLMITVANALEI